MAFETAAPADPGTTSDHPGRVGPWWRTAVIYEIYPRSFADSDGDGIGDLDGIRSRLDYLAALSIDAVWLTPFYPSPLADGGYDVADYCDVDPSLGTLPGFTALLNEAHERGLKIIIDIVPNHTSDRHAWFQAALPAEPASPERRRYIFRDGRGVDGELPPNNWVSNFGGPAWTRVPDGQWYLHLFAPEQPDLDWTQPEVVQEFHRILRFWLDLGVDGLRIDVAHGLVKDPALSDLGSGTGHLLTADNANDHPHWDRDELHEVYRGWRRVVDEYGPDRVFVAEACVPNPDRFARYLRADELHTAFNFNFLEAEWEASAVRAVIDRTLDELRAVGAPATWVLSNHDVTRHVTRFGGGSTGLSRARAALMLMLALPGGTYLYQGEELGLEEVLDIPRELRVDPMVARTGGERLGRDGCRIPLPWSGDESPFGFSTAGTHLPQPAAWARLTVQAQDGDAGSTLNFYRSALRHRRELPDVAAETPLTWVDSVPGVLAFTRGGLACVVNYRPTVQPVPAGLAGTVRLSSSDAASGTVAPDSAIWINLHNPPTT